MTGRVSTGCRLQGATWRCNRCGAALALVNLDDRTIRFKRHAVVLLDNHADGTESRTTAHRRPVLPPNMQRDDAVAREWYVMIDQTDRTVWIKCGRTGRNGCADRGATDTLEPIAAPPWYWAQFGPDPYAGA